MDRCHRPSPRAFAVTSPGGSALAESASAVTDSHQAGSVDRSFPHSAGAGSGRSGGFAEQRPMIVVMAPSDTNAVGTPRSGRDRILEAAYGLFSRSGVRAIGVDTITAEADVAKMTLYRNFASKHDLAIAFLALREERWTQGWVRAEIGRRADTPAGQLLAIFEIFSEWFAREDFEGCAFITSLLEYDDAADPVRQACVAHLANIRAMICELAQEAGVADPERFSGQWHILMKGSIVAAHEGDAEAAMKAREMGMLLLAREGVPAPGA